MTPDKHSAPRPLEAVALAHVQRRLQAAAAAPWLHAEVARRMAERLPIVKLRPDSIVDWGAFLGASHAILASAYPHAQVLAVEPDPARRAASAAAPRSRWWPPRRWAASPARVLAETELEAGQAQLLWSNMGLHGTVDPQAVMAAWHRALQVGGFLMFSTLGPGSLEGLRSLYAARGWPPPHAPFVDMHDLGDMLVAAGFADPVMDQETITLSWPSGDALLAELRQIGGNVHRRRHAGLRTPAWRRALVAALQAAAGPDGRPRMAFELVYGHAFRASQRPRVAAQTAVTVDELRAMARAGRALS